MKRILLSLSVLVVAVALIAGGTYAFYSDTETSTGNIFVAGSIDLTVDHESQTYNGVDCETCSVNIWSSESTQVTGGTGAYNGGYPTNSVLLSFVHNAWLQEIPGSDAEWIWVTNPVLQADISNGAEYTFEKTFNWNGGIDGVNLDIALASDNGYKIVFNGVTVADELGTETNYGALVDTSAAEPLMLSEVQNGENTLEIIIWNKPGGSNPQNNPAGLIFDLTVERPEQECEDDSQFQQSCMLWIEQDLDGSQTFFNFGDIKPADSGTNLISLHVDDNDSYACLLTSNLEDDENGVIDPEIEDNDTLADGVPNGELSEELEFFVWEDDGDGEYENGENIILPAGTPMQDISTQIVALELTGGGPTQYVGLAWCAGAQSLNVTTIECDGAGMGNIAQTDSVLSDLVAYAEQTRNNDGFLCEDVNLDAPQGDPAPE